MKPTFIDHTGQTFNLYDVEYKHDGKSWSLQFWARDIYDAEVKLAAIQKTPPDIREIMGQTSADE